MKRKLLPLLLLCASGATALAQPTLTGATSNPLPGDAYTTQMGSTMTDPGPTGAGQTWNFGAATSTSSSSVIFTDCSGVSDCASFPGTTVVGQQNDGSVSYLKANSSVQATSGVKTPTSTLTYSDQDEFMRFPLTYNDMYTDSWAATFVSSGMTWYRKGTSQVTADAYGTLITPAGTFGNVLRLHLIQTFRDSTDMMGEPFTVDYVIHSYTWFNTSFRHMLYTISQSTALGSTSESGAWVAPSLRVNGVADLKASLDVFPQPATGKLNLRFNSQKQAALSMQLTDISGRTVLQVPAQSFPAGQNQTTIDLSHLQAGMYFLQLKEGNQCVAAQKVQVL